MRAFLLAASAVVAFASPATAATYNNFNGTTGTFGNDLVAPAGTFADQFTFVLSRVGNVSSGVFSSMSSADTNIDFSVVRLTGPNGFSANYTPTSTGVFELRTFGPNVLSAGTYTLDVQGRSGGVASYAGNMTLAGVPEPAAWALMILGFGAVGSAMRRRQAVAAKVRFA